jgi:hypothetical protein
MVVLFPRGFAYLIAPERITAWAGRSADVQCLSVASTPRDRGAENTWSYTFGDVTRWCHVRFAQKATEIVRRRNMSRRAQAQKLKYRDVSFHHGLFRAL